KDIEEIARCLTGWTYNYDSNSQNFGKFQFYPDWHDTGTKHVLGRVISNNGITDGETVIRILTTFSPQKTQTAQFLGKKFARYFYGDQPEQEVIDAVANAYLQTTGDIKAMLRACLREDFMRSAPPKFKRPFHFLISSVRQGKVDVLQVDIIRYFLNIAGH